MTPEEHLEEQSQSLTPSERLEIIEFWNTPAGEVDFHIRTLCCVAKDLEEDARKREGVHVMRANYKMMLCAKRKLDKLFYDLGPFALETQ